jgi:ribosomal protein S18 acetylase RimI-like enzyme
MAVLPSGINDSPLYPLVDSYSLFLRMPPNANCDDLFTTIRSGLWKLKYQLCREGRARFFAEFYPLLHDTKASVLGDRNDTSWYLVYIGTRPAARGNGYARKSIEYVTKLADENGEPCYLESSNAINPAIYAKMGFKIKEKIELKRAESRVELDIMVREPGLETCSIGVGGGGKDMIETPN